MKHKGTSLYSNALIWFGAGVSLAEILTGTAYASMKLTHGIAAILIGHLIGGVLMFLAGLIGAKNQKSAMETAKMSFGSLGALLFCVLNIAQLTGWTAIMIYDGSIATNSIIDAGPWLWCLVIGGLIVMWISVGIRNLHKVNTVAMAGLFMLTIVLCKVVFFDTQGVFTGNGDAMSFGAALELAVAMPLSWLPLISDYTREAEKPVAATAVSAAVYCVVSCWMYIIGMGAAALAGSSDIAEIMLRAGLGLMGLLIIVLSTVTTTFLDAYSAGVSSAVISKKVSEKSVAVGVTVIGIIGAILYPMDDITGFLYFIGSVFAPMVAVLIADYYILDGDYSKQNLNISNLALWLVGFILYRLFMRIDLIFGSTLPSMLITILLCLAFDQTKKYLFKPINGPKLMEKEKEKQIGDGMRILDFEYKETKEVTKKY